MFTLWKMCRCVDVWYINSVKSKCLYTRVREKGSEKILFMHTLSTFSKSQNVPASSSNANVMGGVGALIRSQRMQFTHISMHISMPMPTCVHSACVNWMQIDAEDCAIWKPSEESSFYSGRGKIHKCRFGIFWFLGVIDETNNWFLR